MRTHAHTVWYTFICRAYVCTYIRAYMYVCITPGKTLICDMFSSNPQTKHLTGVCVCNLVSSSTDQLPVSVSQQADYPLSPLYPRTEVPLYCTVCAYMYSVHAYIRTNSMYAHWCVYEVRIFLCILAYVSTYVRTYVHVRMYVCTLLQ